jgi:CRP-like cAMP-binding protein
MPDASALISGLLETHCTLAPRSCTAKLCLESLTHQVLTPLSPQSPAESVSGSRRRSPSPAGSPPLQQSPAGMEGAPLLDPDVHAALKDSVLFGGLTDAELTEVALAFSPLRCAAGQALLLAGEPNESFFVVASGVFAQYEHHRRRTGPTDQWNLGELPLSPGRGRNGSAFSRGSTDAGTAAGAAGSRGSIGRGSIAAAAAAAASAVSAAAGSRGSISRSSISRSSIAAAGAGGSRNSIAGGSRGSIAGGSRGSIAAAAASSTAASGWLSPLSADDAVKGGMSQVLCGRGAMFGELNLLLAGALCSKSVVCAMDGGLAYAITRVRLRRVLARVGLRERAEVLSALGGVPLLHQLTKEQLRKLADRVEVLSFAEGSQVSRQSMLHNICYAHARTAMCVHISCCSLLSGYILSLALMLLQQYVTVGSSVLLCYKCKR